MFTHKKLNEYFILIQKKFGELNLDKFMVICQIQFGVFPCQCFPLYGRYMYAWWKIVYLWKFLTNIIKHHQKQSFLLQKYTVHRCICIFMLKK